MLQQLPEVSDVVVPSTSRKQQAQEGQEEDIALHTTGPSGKAKGQHM